jgi:hypothetical protein
MNTGSQWRFLEPRDREDKVEVFGSLALKSGQFDATQPLVSYRIKQMVRAGRWFGFLQEPPIVQTVTW